MSQYDLKTLNHWFIYLFLDKLGGSGGVAILVHWGFLFSIFLTSSIALAQQSFDPAPIQRWADSLKLEIVQQRQHDQSAIAEAKRFREYNKLSQKKKWMPTLTFHDPEAVAASEREMYRSDDCLGKAVEERLKSEIESRCNLAAVATSCQFNPHNFNKEIESLLQKRTKILNGSQTQGALSFAKEVRLATLRDAKELQEKNISCGNALGLFLNNDQCANTYAEVLEPLRGLIKDSCTTKAIDDQVEAFVVHMTDGLGGGFADRLYKLAENHIEARKAEGKIASDLITIDNWIYSFENNLRAPAAALRPKARRGANQKNRQGLQQ